MGPIQLLAVAALPLLFAITLHEVAHGRAAKRLGDDTAARLGRLSPNPLRHIDPIGTLVVPALMLILVGFILGWAKPVPVDFRALRNPRRDMALVALAGPLANLLMALIWALLLKLGLLLGPGLPWVGVPLSYMAAIGIWLNLILMVLNLLPIPPLDGGRVVTGMLPARAAGLFERIEPFGFFILIALVVLGVLGDVLIPATLAVTGFIEGLFGLPGVMGILTSMAP
jgi:Zn-dependent protease